MPVVFHPFRTALIPLALAICLFAGGCRTPGDQCERALALMRAEIVDVENKYAQLQSKYESTAAELSEYTGQPVDMTFIDDPTISDDSLYLGDPVLIDGETYYEGAAPGEMIYDSAPGYQSSPTLIAPADPSNVIGSGVEPAPRASSPRLPQATPPPSGSGDLPLPGEGDEGAFNLQLESPSQSRQSIPTTSAGYRRTSRPLTEVVVHRTATRPQNIDGVAGDDGVRLLIQPRTVGGRVSLEPGEMTISIVDPQQPAGSQRIGLWKFLPEETELFFVNDELGSQGILLHLPWEHATPQRSRLIVHVRYVGPAGNIFRTSSDLRIEPPPASYSAQHPAIMAWARQDWRESAASLEHRRVQGDRALDGERVEPKRDQWNWQTQKSQGATTPNNTTNTSSGKPRWRPVR